MFEVRERPPVEMYAAGCELRKALDHQQRKTARYRCKRQCPQRRAHVDMFGVCRGR